MGVYSGAATIVSVVARGGSSASWSPSGANYVSGGVSVLNAYTDYICFSGFPLFIPVREYVTGIVVAYSISGNPNGPSTGSPSNDSQVFIQFPTPGSPALGCVNHATGAGYNWPAQTVQTRGTSVDNWGCSLLASNANNSNFGFFLSCTLSATTLNPLVFSIANNPTITVYTNASGGGTGAGGGGGGGTSYQLPSGIMAVQTVTPIQGVTIF